LWWIILLVLDCVEVLICARISVYGICLSMGLPCCCCCFACYSPVCATFTCLICSYPAHFCMVTSWFVGLLVPCCVLWPLVHWYHLVPVRWGYVLALCAILLSMGYFLTWTKKMKLQILRANMNFVVITLFKGYTRKITPWRIIIYKRIRKIN
jgi:hypothetical protein